MSVKRSRKKAPERRVITLTLPEDMISAIDDLGTEVDENRSAVVEAILAYGLQEEHLDEIFPYEEDEEEDQEGNQ